MLCEKLSNLRFDGLGQQRTRAAAQDLCEGIGEGPWLGELDDVTVRHGVSLLHWRSGGVEHHHDTPPYPVTPSPTSGHSSPGCEAYTVIGWGVGLSHERKNFAEAETLGTVEGNMCGIAMRDAVAPPGSKATSRPKGTRRNLRGLMAGHRLQSRLVRIGKVRNRSR